MFSHYLTTALRNFWRNRISTTVNVLGLSIGLVCLISAFSFALLLTHGDENFTKSDRILFFTTHFGILPGTSTHEMDSIATPAPLLRHVGPAFPELEEIGRVHMAGDGEMAISADGKP